MNIYDKLDKFSPILWVFYGEFDDKPLEFRAPYFQTQRPIPLQISPINIHKHP